LDLRRPSHNESDDMTIRLNAYERHGPEVLAFLRRRLWNHEEAEDLCQETFYRALKAESNLRDESKLRPYLLRIANNLFLNHIRRPAVVTSESDLGEDSDITAFADPVQTSPMAAAEKSEFKEKLEALLMQLPKEQQMAFELGVLRHQPYAMVAKETGWSVAKVKVNVYRARKQLMAGLREYMPGAQAPDGSK